MGCNAYRSSHNAPTAELLDACDQLGMLVLDENRRIGTNAEPLGESSRQIRRDRNHPSVFPPGPSGTRSPSRAIPVGAAILQPMQNPVHQLDPSRLCTIAMSGRLGSGFSTVLDVQGFNYNLGRPWTPSTPATPAQPCMGTETSSQITDRGMYTNDTSNGYLWGYDLNPVSWGETAEAWWQYYFARPWSSGGFCWTGFDYRGEPTPYGWPCINSHFGVVDMCGFPKDIFYYYRPTGRSNLCCISSRTGTGQRPASRSMSGPLAIARRWNCSRTASAWDGKTLNVLGHVEWDNVPYAPGMLQAIGYNNGVAVITNTIVTTGAPAQIALWPDRSAILADGSDVSVVTVAILDALGNIVPTASNTVTFAVNGGTILGVGNGNPSSHEADKASSQRSVFNGLAEVIVQSTSQPGPITVTATAAGLTSTNITITEAATLPAPAAPTGVAAVGGNAQVTVSWDIVPGATTYNLWRATTSGGPYTLIAGNIGGVNLGYTDNNVTNLTTYYYVVTANGNGTSANSAEVSATPEAIVTGLTATATNGQIVLNWNGSPGANYNVKRSSRNRRTLHQHRDIHRQHQLHRLQRGNLPDLFLCGHHHQCRQRKPALDRGKRRITGSVAAAIHKRGHWRRWPGRQRHVVRRTVHGCRFRCGHLEHLRRVPVCLCLRAGQHQLRHPRPCPQHSEYGSLGQGWCDDPRDIDRRLPQRLHADFLRQRRFISVEIEHRRKLRQ